jgi:hypothetical protein
MNDMRKLMEAIEESGYWASPHPREVTNKIHEMMDEGLLDPRTVAEAALGYMSEAEVSGLADDYGWVETLDEAPLRRDDPEMLDYDMDQEEQAADTADAPYYVGWAAQSWEWYGDGDPADGKGRYKPKGDGGRIVAINVPTFAQAQKIADQLDADYENGDFEDSNVYGKQGMSGYVLDYHGAFVEPMSKMDPFDKEHIEKYVHPNFKPKDYSAE